MSGTYLTQLKQSRVTLFFHGQEVPWCLQLPASCIPTFSGKVNWVKVALACPAVPFGMLQVHKWLSLV